MASSLHGLGTEVVEVKPIGNSFDRFSLRLFGRPSPDESTNKSFAGAGTLTIVDNQVRLLGMILKLSMLVSCAVLTMTAQEIVQPNLDGFKYPVLARSARIQGTVEFVVKSDGIQLVSGHPMLAAAAKSNLEKWAVPYAPDTTLSVTYHFSVGAPEFKQVDEPIGDRFDRFFLRLFHRPVTRQVNEQVCLLKERAVASKNETKDGVQSVEIDIESASPCLNTDAVAIADLRLPGSRQLRP